MVERIEDISGLPEIGKRYLVPTVTAQWFGYKIRAWPVIGPKHNDKHCLNFEPDHYHLDSRFMDSFGRNDDDYFFWKNVAVAPVVTSERINSGGLPALVWRLRVCKRAENPVATRVADMVSEHESFRCLTDYMAGKQSKHDGRGWVCPHRNVPLSGQPLIDGVIRCPLHFLRIDAATGKVLPRQVAHG